MNSSDLNHRFQGRVRLVQTITEGKVSLLTSNKSHNKNNTINKRTHPSKMNAVGTSLPCLQQQLGHTHRPKGHDSRRKKESSSIFRRLLRQPQSGKHLRKATTIVIKPPKPIPTRHTDVTSTRVSSSSFGLSKERSPHS